MKQKQVKLKKTLLTHGHLDHVGGTAELANHLKLSIEGPHRDDSFWLDGFKTDRWLADGDTVQVGQISLQVRHCPGHTPGHVIFFQPQARLAFVGDVIFNGAIGRTDFPRGNHQQLLNSIRLKLWPLGDNITFIPGHGPNSTFGNEPKSNPFVADARFG